MQQLEMAMDQMISIKVQMQVMAQKMMMAKKKSFGHHTLPRLGA